MPICMAKTQYSFSDSASVSVGKALIATTQGRPYTFFTLSTCCSRLGSPFSRAVRLCEEPNQFSFVYEEKASIQEKLDTIVKRVYHGDKVVLTANAKKQAQQLSDLGFGEARLSHGGVPHL